MRPTSSETPPPLCAGYQMVIDTPRPKFASGRIMLLTPTPVLSPAA
ncbi:hypothetical protein [Alloyangia mangrovi]|nr:hypothetical protein [Alloyangia mangrovi]